MTGTEPSKEKIYSELARAFKYTPSEIADMTPHQQIALYDPEAVAETLQFETYQEYMEYYASRK